MTKNSSAPAPEIAQDLAAIDVLTVLQALSDPVRLEIVRQLAANGQCMCRELRHSGRQVHGQPPLQDAREGRDHGRARRGHQQVPAATSRGARGALPRAARVRAAGLGSAHRGCASSRASARRRAARACTGAAARRRPRASRPPRRQALVHDRDAVAQVAHDREIVRDEDQASGSKLVGELAQQVEDLRAHGHVERADRLVRDQERRPGRQRARDRDPLALSARELVRVARCAASAGRPTASSSSRRARRGRPGSSRARSGSSTISRTRMRGSSERQRVLEDDLRLSAQEAQLALLAGR